MRPSTVQSIQTTATPPIAIPPSDSPLPHPPPLISTPTSPSSTTTPTPTLATAINTATRPLHTTLNRLIIARLPLALTPITSTPLLYTIGLSAFASIYTTFEDAWTVALSSSSSQNLTPDLHAALTLLFDPRIRRTDALKRDIAALQALLHIQNREGQRHRQDALDLLNTVSHNLNTSFPTHIHSAIASRPHVVVAYAWVMYMALFSGGRWIRLVLREAGTEFWGHAHSHQQEQQQEGPKDEMRQGKVVGIEEGAGYSFLMFDGSQDGEDVKAAFKAQLTKVEEVMSNEQREGVVQEARYIFQACIELVEELDARLATPSDVTKLQDERETENENKKTAKEEPQSGMQTTAAPLLLALALVLLLITVAEPLKRLVSYTGYAYSYDGR